MALICSELVPPHKWLMDRKMSTPKGRGPIKNHTRTGVCLVRFSFTAWLEGKLKGSTAILGVVQFCHMHTGAMGPLP